MALKPTTTVEDVKAKAAAKRAAAKAAAAQETTAAPAAEPTTAPAQPTNPLSAKVEQRATETGTGDNTHPYSLEQVAEMTGVNDQRINGYRRLGTVLPDGSFGQYGRAIRYNDVAVQAIKSAAAAGVSVPRPGSTGNGKRGRPKKEATNGAVATAAPVSKRPASSGDVLGALDAAIASAEAEAKRHAELASSLKAQRKQFGGR